MFESQPVQQSSRFGAWGPAILAFLGGVFAMVPPLLGLLDKHPYWSKTLVGISAALFASVAVWVLWKLLRICWHGLQDRLFVRKEDRELRELLRRLQVFTSNHDGRSLICIIRNANFGNMDLVSRTLGGSENVLQAWVEAYRQQTAFPATSIDVFLPRCRELTCMIAEFNRSYVHRANKELATGISVNEAYIHQFENFREELRDFLTDVEKWAQGVSAYLRESRPEVNITELPGPVYERVNTFRRNISIAVNGITVNGV